MPPIKLQHVISFTSEDPKYKTENLLSGNGMWLCSPAEQSGSIKAELQLQKAMTIDYIDIGNRNSAMLCIEVGMSSWPSSQNFASLLPTVVLMNPSDCRSGQNSKTVRMFKRENLDKINVSKKWDRIRVVCSQPFRKNTQYGLAFLKLYSQGDTSKENSQLSNPSEMDEGREAIFTSVVSKSPSHAVMSESLQLLENCRINADDSTLSPSNSHSSKPLTSPISRAGRLVMAHKHIPNETESRQHKKALECEALTFLISMNLTNEDIHSLKVSHIREEFEIRRKKTLNTREKLIFKNIALDYATERIKKLQTEEEAGADSSLLSTSSDDENKTSSSKSKFKKTFSFKRMVNSSPSPHSAKKMEKAILHSPRGFARNDLALIDTIVTPSSECREGRKRGRSSQSDDESERCKKSMSRKKDGTPSKLSTNSAGISFDLDVFSAENVGSSPSSEASACGLGIVPMHKFGAFREDSEGTPNSLTELVECPLCTDLFSSNSVEEHASDCDGKYSSAIHNSPSEASTSSSKNLLEECPICEIFVDTSELREHAEACAERNFS